MQFSLTGKAMSVLCSGTWSLTQSETLVQVTDKMRRLKESAFLPPVNIVHEEESASCFHHVHGCVNVLDPGRETKVSK